MEKLLALAKTARMGDPMAGDTQVGPITTRPKYDKVLSYIDIAKQDGAKLALGGKPGSQPQCGKGWFVEPNIFNTVKHDKIGRACRRERMLLSGETAVVGGHLK